MKNAKSVQLARDVFVPTDHPMLNRNVLVVASPGSGKTASFVSVNIASHLGSYVVADPKGRLYSQHAEHLKKGGYDVHVLDFSDFASSEGYNPVENVHSTQDAIILATAVVQGSGRRSPSGLDPFWDDAATMLCSSLCYFLATSPNVPKKDRSLGGVLALIRKGARSSTGRCPLDIAMETEGGWALAQYKNAAVSPDKTWASILATLSSKLWSVQSKEAMEMSIRPGVRLSEIGARKTAVFVRVSDTDRSGDTFAAMFFAQLLRELCKKADENGGRLAVPTYLVLDDFATNIRIPEFPRMISSFRSRGIAAFVILQAESQLASLYGDDARTIAGCCDSYVYMGGEDLATARNVAERADVPVRAVLEMKPLTAVCFRRGMPPAYAPLCSPPKCAL